MDCCGKELITPFCPFCGAENKDEISEIKRFLNKHIDSKIRGSKSSLIVSERELERKIEEGISSRREERLRSNIDKTKENIKMFEKAKKIVSELI